MSEAQIKFLEILETCKVNRKIAALILDLNGLEKIQGFVEKIEDHVGVISIQLDNGFRFELQQIIAINGYFDPLYSKC